MFLEYGYTCFISLLGRLPARRRRAALEKVVVVNADDPVTLTTTIGE
jgi:hypothetical protein